MADVQVERLHISMLNGVEYAQMSDLLLALHLDWKEGPSREALLEQLRRNKVFVARAEDGTIIGTATLVEYYHVSRLWGIIEEVVVAESSRGQGVGRKLMKAVMDEAAESALEKVFLTSNDTRVAAHALYQSFDFHKVSTNLFLWSGQ